MKKGRSKSKGSAFERDVCKQLSLWVSKGKHKDLFWRSSMSGGRATVTRKRGSLVRQAGDITAVMPEGHKLTDRWYIECKHYKSIDLPQFIIGGHGHLAKWWARTRSEARLYGKVPVLIAKQNGWPILLVCPRGSLDLVPHASIMVPGRYCDIHLLTNITEIWAWPQ